jgi:hypothetical protein
VDKPRSGALMQMPMVLRRFLRHFGVHDVFGRIAKQG